MHALLRSTTHLQEATSFLLLSFTLSAPRETRAMHSSADSVVPLSRDPTLFTETCLCCRGDSSIVDRLTLEDCVRLTLTVRSLVGGGAGASLMKYIGEK